MSGQCQQHFIHYLKHDLAVSEEAIDLALRRQEPSQGLLLIVLWQHGLIDLDQLGKEFEWRVNKKVATANSWCKA